MKIKLLSIILCVLLLSGCKAPVPKEYEIKSSAFVLLEATSDWDIVYCADTKVMYSVSKGSYNRGTFTLLVNADGTPMVYGEN